MAELQKKPPTFHLNHMEVVCYCECHESPRLSSWHSGSLITCGNIVYVFLFGWWVSLAYFLVGILLFITVIGASYGRSAVIQSLCLRPTRCCNNPFSISLTFQANFAGSCRTTSCGLLARQSIRWILISLDTSISMSSKSSFIIYLFLNWIICTV